MVISEGTVPLEILVSQNLYCTEPKGVKLSSMLKTNKTNINRTYDSTMSENKEIEIPITCAEKHLFDTDSLSLESVTADDMSIDSETAGNAFARENVEIYEVYEEDQEVSYMIPMPKNGKVRDLSLTPITIMVVNTIDLKKSRKLLKVLLDP